MSDEGCLWGAVPTIPAALLRRLPLDLTELTGLGRFIDSKVDFVDFKGDLVDLRGGLVDLKGDLVDIKGELSEANGY